MNSQNRSPPATNSRWKRESTNSFHKEERTSHHLQRNSRWKKEDDNRRENTSQNHFRNYRDRRNDRPRRNRFRPRNQPQQKKKPIFKLEESEFPALTTNKSNNTIIGPQLSVGNWVKAALKGKDKPNPICEKADTYQNDSGIPILNIPEEEINWSDEELLPDDDSIDQYDEEEYVYNDQNAYGEVETQDDMDDLIF